MSNIQLIVLARAVHVMAGVTWAGSVFLLAAVIVPMAARPGTEGAGHWTGIITRRVGPLSGISALLTVLSGSYLFATLHPHDDSVGGIVLRTGAIAALLALAVGALIGRPAGVKLARIREQHSAAALSEEVLQRMTRLSRRGAWSSRLTAALLGLTVVSMAVFRYAQAMV